MSRVPRFHALVAISLLSVLSYGQVWFFHDVMWDDNCWFLSFYSSGTLRDFLKTAFVDLRREQLGVLLYYVIGLHKWTDSYYVIAHSINLATQILSPVVLYLLVRNLFGRPLLALFVSLGFVAFPLDHELPHVSGIHYRVGLLLSIASLYLTERGLAGENIRWSYLLVSLGSAVISYYLFIEATLSLEIGRLALIGYVFSRQDGRRSVLIRNAVLYWLPFFLAIIPLALSKFLYRPYGVYQGTYETDLLFFLDYRHVFKTLAHVVFFPWIALLNDLHYTTAWSIWTGILAMAISLVFLTRLTETVSGISDRADHVSGPNLGKDEMSGSAWRVARPSILLGASFLIPPACLYLYARQPLAGTGFSAHASMLQIGSSMLIGTLLWALYCSIGKPPRRRTVANVLLSGILSLGVFFNNLNLDLYFDSWTHQTRFWQAFVKRFPSLPEKASFFFDVEDGAYYSDLRNPNDFELHLNLLYATSPEPALFHKYSAYTKREFDRRSASSRTEQGLETIHRTIQPWGKETLDPRQFIAVHYRGHELLVNREILNRYPNIEYRQWLDKDFPPLPKAPVYVLRRKVEGF